MKIIEGNSCNRIYPIELLVVGTVALFKTGVIHSKNGSPSAYVKSDAPM